MKVYIAGPMSSYPAWNFPAFYAMEERLKEEGHEVINPAREFDSLENPSEMTWAECMKHILRHFVDADAIVMLEGWETSSGAGIEAYLSIRFEMKMLDRNTLEEITGSIVVAQDFSLRKGGM